jgi:hypothetical protein
MEEQVDQDTGCAAIKVEEVEELHAVGSAGTPSIGGAGGAGKANSISGSPVSYAGGGGGGSYCTTNFGSGAAGGTGGGGTGGHSPVGVQDLQEQLILEVEVEVENLEHLGQEEQVVQESLLLEHQEAAGISVAPGTNTVTTLPAPAGGCKVATFTVSGTLTT